MSSGSPTHVLEPVPGLDLGGVTRSSRIRIDRIYRRIARLIIGEWQWSDNLSVLNEVREIRMLLTTLEQTMTDELDVQGNRTMDDSPELLV